MAIYELQQLLDVYQALQEPTVNQRLEHICHIVKMANFYSEELRDYANWKSVLTYKMRQIWDEICETTTVDKDLKIRFFHGLQKLEINYRVSTIHGPYKKNVLN